MTNCKPCITIRQITRIIYINLKDCYKNIKDDIKAYRTVNATVCHLDTGKYGTIPPNNIVAAIKKEAQEKYDKENATALLKEAHEYIEKEAHGRSAIAPRG
jgi:hypothetical protein